MMNKILFLLNMLVVNSFLCASGGQSAVAQKATSGSLIGSGGVEELMAQQSACAPAANAKKPWIFATGKRPGPATFSHDGSLLAVANYVSQSVSVYRVNAQGVLSPVQGSPFATGKKPRSAKFSPVGRLLAVEDDDSDSIYMYGVNAQGVLSAVQGSPFATRSNHQSATFSPDGSLLAVANFVSRSVSVYGVNAQGVLSSVQGSPFATESRPQSATFSPDGRLLAVANSGSNSVSVYGVNAQGVLSPVQRSPFATGRSPQSATFSPDGRLLAVVNYVSNSVSVYRVNDQGVLSPVQGSPFATGNGPSLATFSHDGSLLAVANYFSNSVSVYRVNDQGVLSPVQRSPFATGRSPQSATFSPDGRLLAVANAGDNCVWMYEVDPDTGAISPITGGPLKAAKKEYQEAHKVLVEPVSPILPKDIVENVFQGFVTGEEQAKKQDKDAKESDDELQQKIKKTQEQEKSRALDANKLFQAIKEGKIADVGKHLTPFTINAKDDHYETPLIAAIKLKDSNKDIINTILNYEGEIVREDGRPEFAQANLLAKDKENNTPLLLAVLLKKDFALALAIAKKMTPEQRNAIIKDGKSALVYVVDAEDTMNKKEYEELIQILQTDK
jgi:6-phosphogluconolactonase (cycloisomerase 2 family)